MKKTLTVKIGGEAGFGIMTTGLMLSRLANRHGFFVFDYVEYPSLIRGGHNVYEVRFGQEEIFSQEKGVDLLVCLNQETLSLHQSELKEEAAVLFDDSLVKANINFNNKKISLIPIPFTQLIKQAGVSVLMQNNIALGAVSAILGFDLKVLFELIKEVFLDKGEQIITDNQKAAQIGFDYVLNRFSQVLPTKLETNKVKGNKLVVTGNDAVSLAAIAAGCGFYAAYPMTPSSSVLHTLAALASQSGMVVKHAEDEIAAINMAIGASFAGVRAMCGTSGGGFSLMTEGLGLAGITETPLVILEAQRPGPATGMPTWTAQADLQFLIHASQDEFPRIILAPGDPSEAFYLTFEAFNLADIYQTPVFILSDKYLSESHKSVEEFDWQKLQIKRGKIITDTNSNLIASYQRYQLTEDGVSPFLIPGLTKATFLANSYEHDESGFATEEASVRTRQVNKRNQKLKTYQKNLPLPKIYGEKQADLTLIGWGSTKGPVLQALHDCQFSFKGSRMNFLHLNQVWPLNIDFLTEFFKTTQRRIMIEGNSTGQMANLLREHTGFLMDDYLLKYDGRPFYPEEILAKLDQIL